MTDVCFGPCTQNFYQAVASKDTFEVECSRYYETKALNKGCDTQVKSVWDLTLPAVNEFSGIDTAYNEGRGLQACEEVLLMLLGFALISAFALDFTFDFTLDFTLDFT